MLQLISATGQQTVDALAFLLAFALTALMDSVFHDKLPHDHGRAFAVNGELSKGKARGSGLIFVLCIALVTLAVVPFKVEYLIYTVLLIASMLSGYFDDASETAWNEYKKGLIDLVIAVVAAVTGTVDAGCTAQCVHTQAGIIGDGGQTADLADRFSLDEGILCKGGARLVRLDGDAQFLLADHLMSLRFQNAAQLAELTGVAGGCTNFHFPRPLSASIPGGEALPQSPPG